MSQTPSQVARVISELRALLMQLHWSAFQGFNPNDQNLILNDLLDATLIEDLRTTVDQLSHFLWCYVDAVAANSEPDPDYDLQSKRLIKITEMLRVLHSPGRPAEDPAAFVQRLTRAVDRHLETANQDVEKLETMMAAKRREATGGNDSLPGASVKMV